MVHTEVLSIRECAVTCADGYAGGMAVVVQVRVREVVASCNFALHRANGRTGCVADSVGLGDDNVLKRAYPPAHRAWLQMGEEFDAAPWTALRVEGHKVFVRSRTRSKKKDEKEDTRRQDKDSEDNPLQEQDQKDGHRKTKTRKDYVPGPRKPDFLEWGKF
ncbi:hypothetical protein BDZ89DRAFT_1116223 [Hymenopellis radicata]|nr:hypothetical protein BDZ89DRAFT_1116223 [Hymenopellis radicata]